MLGMKEFDFDECGGYGIMACALSPNFVFWASFRSKKKSILSGEFRLSQINEILAVRIRYLHCYVKPIWTFQIKLTIFKNLLKPTKRSVMTT